jgi:CDP-diacylglycerol--glycerol-3-phosphate 3-phosphatidyltransferase
MANLITLSRLLLLLIVVWIFYLPPTPWAFANFFLIILIYFSDLLDGYVARKRNESSLFGALFDIAGDRIVELTLWIVAADIDLVPVWVPLVFVIRGVIVDAIRSSNVAAEGMAPFALMRSRIGKFLVVGSFMRNLYGVCKASAFAGLALLRPGAEFLPEVWGYAGRPRHWTYLFLRVSLCGLVRRTGLAGCSGVSLQSEYRYPQAAGEKALKLAIFDIDGTLVRGSSERLFWRYLAARAGRDRGRSSRIYRSCCATCPLTEFTR